MGGGEGRFDCLVVSMSSFFKLPRIFFQANTVLVFSIVGDIVPSEGSSGLEAVAEGAFDIDPV